MKKREDIRKTGRFESPVREVLEILNLEEEGHFGTSNRFGNLYIERNGRDILNTAHLSALSAEDIVGMVKNKFKQPNITTHKKKELQ